jgi:tetratricopeptide (TPR) repeat protein
MMYSHAEALSNIAATLYCLNRQEEAERHWLQAIKIRPQYLEAVEHLVGLLYKKRSKEAVDLIDFVQRSLRRQPDRATEAGQDKAKKVPFIPEESNSQSHCTQVVGKAAHSSSLELDCPGFGSSGYAISGSENGRMLALVHTKGTMLYSLKDIKGASEAFEEAVLISTGRQVECVQNLVRRIQTVLSTDGASYPAASKPQCPGQPLLLPPEKARTTAQLVFSGNGELPGLRFVPDGSPRRAAIQTTSNSLLSLAKIFQDAVSNGGHFPGLLRQPSGVGDILALYYLSLSLQESPSTANNVGILLASVQSSVPACQAQATVLSSPVRIPGIVPGSGLALALSYYHYGLSLDSKHVHLHTNLGSLLKDIGQLDLAIQMYEQAVSCDGTFDIALTNLANAVKDRGRINDAIIYYKRAVSSNPEFSEAVCGLSTALNSVCDWRGRGGVLLQGGKYDRWHVDEDGMLQDAQLTRVGSGLMKRVVDIVERQLEDASKWGHGVLQPSVISSLVSQLQVPSSTIAHTAVELQNLIQNWTEQPWEGARIIRLIERYGRILMRQWYHDKYNLGVESHRGYSRLQPPPNLTVPAAPTVLPFHAFTCPLTARDIRRISQRNAMRISCSTLRSPWLPPTVYMPPPPPQPHLNIGYVSSDFNNHPLAHL